MGKDKTEIEKRIEEGGKNWRNEKTQSLGNREGGWEVKTNPESSTFPMAVDMIEPQWGLTKREYFAAMAMQGILSNFAAKNLEASSVSKEALFHADALIEELNKKVE